LISTPTKMTNATTTQNSASRKICMARSLSISA
jgi:hypothetical protein